VEGGGGCHVTENTSDIVPSQIHTLSFLHITNILARDSALNHQDFLILRYGYLVAFRICVTVVPVIHICRPTHFLLPPLQDTECALYESLLKWLDYLATIFRPRN
jgi:hypothetical protein